MGWRQMMVGAVVGQVAEWIRERRQHRPAPSDATSPDASAEMDDQGAYAPDADRAIGGKLNPLNAAEDMLRRVIDHAQYRTDQSMRRAVGELQAATERQWPLMSENAQLAADRTVELAAQRLEAATKRLAEDVAARTAIVIDEKLSRADAMLKQHREDAARQMTRLLLLAGAVLLVVGAALIFIASAAR